MDTLLAKIEELENRVTQLEVPKHMAKIRKLLEIPDHTEAAASLLLNWLAQEDWKGNLRYWVTAR